MKKLFAIILLSLFCLLSANAEENKELKLIQDYKERLFKSAIKEDLKKVEEICTNYNGFTPSLIEGST